LQVLPKCQQLVAVLRNYKPTTSRLTASCAYCRTLRTVCLQVLAKSQQLVEVLHGCNIWTPE
jgi:hypothetical protein